MTDKYLYTVPIPSDAQTTQRGSARRRVDKQGAVLGASGSATVQGTGSLPGAEHLVGALRGKLANVTGEELDELVNASDIDVVPYFGASGRTPTDGYVALDSVESNPADPRVEGANEFTLDFTRKGTRKSHLRSAATSPRQITNDFGTGSTAYVCVDVEARRPRWFRPSDGATEDASIVEQRPGEHAIVDVYDAEASTYDNPTLVYDLPYTAEGKADVAAFDTRGVSKTTTVDGTEIVRWRRVFRTDSVFDGLVAVDNGHLRIEVDEEANSISALRWGEGMLHRMDDTSSLLAGSNTTAPSVVDSPSYDGLAVEVSEADSANGGNRFITYDPGSTAFGVDSYITFRWYTDHANTVDHLRVRDTSGNADSVTFDSQSEVGEMVEVTVDTSNFTGVDLTSLDQFKWIFDANSGDSTTIAIDSVTTGDEAWAPVSLGSSSWEPYDVDLTYISGSRVVGHYTFRDPSQSPTAYYTLVGAVPRGYTDALWYRPENESNATPTGLQTLLDPIAHGSTFEAQAQAGVVARQEVRK